MNILIATESCIKCGKCVQVCPIFVFTQEKKSVPVVASPDNCFGCGHCVDACPTVSVIHELFPPEKVHVIDYDKRASADSLMLLLKSRRSNRVLKKEAVPDELIDKIIEAASVAPTATNSQLVNYTVVTNKDVLHKISDITLASAEDSFKSFMTDIDNQDLSNIPPKVVRYLFIIKEMRKQFKLGNDLVLRNASTVIFIHAPKTNMYAEIDSNLAYQNGSLMAEALGVSQIYGGFVIEATKKNPTAFAKLLSCDETICAVMILGMPKFKYQAYVDRKIASVKRIK